VGALVAVVFSSIAAAHLDDFGCTWDFGQLYYGERYLSVYRSASLHPLDFSQAPLEGEVSPPDLSRHRTEGPDLVWPLGPELAALTHEFSHEQRPWLPAIASYHLASVLVTAVLLWFLFVFAAPRLGSGAALLGVALLALHPGFLWHVLANFKDPVAAVLFVLASLVGVAAATKQRLGLIVAAAVLWGLALAAKGNALFVPVAVLLGWWAGQGSRAVVAGVLAGSFWRRLLWAAPLSFVVLWACWPWLWADSGQHFQRHVQAVWHNRSGSGAAWGGLLYGFATLPEVWMIGLLGACACAFGLDHRSRPARTATVRVLLTLAAVPLLQASWPGTKHYDSIRRYLEFVPPLALAVAAGWWFWLGLGTRRLSASRALLVRTVVGLGVVTLAALPVLRSHPDQHLYYNSLVGGASGACERGLDGAVDFWGHSYRRVFAWLREAAPSGAAVVTPTGPQVARLSNEMWGREDLQLLGKDLWDPENLPSQTLYVAFVRRPEYYNLLARVALAQWQPVFEVQSQGVVLASVYRLDPEESGRRTELRQLVTLARKQQQDLIASTRAKFEAQPEPLLLVRLTHDVTLLHGIDHALRLVDGYLHDPAFAKQRSMLQEVRAAVERNRPYYSLSR
jgi:hypothetical protein